MFIIFMFCLDFEITLNDHRRTYFSGLFTLYKDDSWRLVIWSRLIIDQFIRVDHILEALM